MLSTLLDNSKYILKVGASASLRLDMLQELHGKYSEQFIAQVQFNPGMSILDIGCGIGNMSCCFARQFPDCRVVGLDNSEAQLLLASQRASYKNLSNLEFRKGDLEDLTDLNEQFDIIYSRYCLIHVSNPMATLKNLKNKLAPNGRIILEEPSMDSAFCYPENAAYKKSRDLLNRLAQLRGFDFEVGKKLETLLHDAGFVVQCRNLVQPLLETVNEKKLLILLTEECRDAYLTHDLISEDEFSGMMVNLENLIRLEGTLIGFPRTTQLCATHKN
ncbi:MAG: methyltransferase domain-containing protein [Gammaproteobacteria bacterium]|nr:methyltransferase domain-containing protein [Gammaproteobacteria bacterium]